MTADRRNFDPDPRITAQLASRIAALEAAAQPQNQPGYRQGQSQLGGTPWGSAPDTVVRQGSEFGKQNPNDPSNDTNRQIAYLQQQLDDLKLLMSNGTNDLSQADAGSVSQLTGDDGNTGTGTVGSPPADDPVAGLGTRANPLLGNGSAAATAAPSPTVDDVLADTIFGSSAPGRKALVIQAQAAQSVDLIQIQDATGATLAAFGPAGALALTTPLGVAGGGTNSATALSGSGVMISDGTRIVLGPAGTVSTVMHGNASGSPSYGPVDLPSETGGILPVTKGGLGTNSAPSSAQIPIGTLGGLYSPKTISGDMTITNAGVVTISNSAVTNAKLATNAVANTNIINGTIDLTTKVTGILPVASGGTGGGTQGAAQAGLGLGTMCTQNATAVAITGGTISGGTITSGTSINHYYRFMATFTASGSFVVPAGTTALYIVIVGGGGGSAGGAAASATFVPATGGGGGGATTIQWINVTAGSTLTVTVGAGGTAGAVGSNGGPGGTSKCTGCADALGGQSVQFGGWGGISTSFVPTFPGLICIPGTDGNPPTVSTTTSSGGNITNITMIFGKGGHPGLHFYTGTGTTGSSGTATYGFGGDGAQAGFAGNPGSSGFVAIYYN